MKQMICAAAIVVFFPAAATSQDKIENDLEIPTEVEPFVEKLFQDFVVYHIECEQLLHPMYSGDPLRCDVRDYIGTLLNAFGWCRDVTVAKPLDWRRCTPNNSAGYDFPSTSFD